MNTARWIWVVTVLVAVMMPWVFHDYHTGRDSGFVISMLSQTGLMVILALSYNMLLGQAGLFSLCHATFFGIGGYATVHFLNAAGAGDFPIPIEVVPLLSGLSGLGLAVVYGFMATKQRATAFAMITMGISELTATAALMFHHFFGGEGGVTTNRMIEHSLFGLTFASGLQVYYLILAWTLLSAGAMYFLTQTPLGRMANATRDNYERAQFMGYDPRVVRFLQFSLSGFFAGIGGGLYAITYEIVTFDALAAPLSANALLMAYIGGTTVFGGPILGAVLITLLQSGVSLLSNSWLVYVGVLFISMVMFAPSGLSGLIIAHHPIVGAGRLGRLMVPYLRLVIPFLALVLGFVGLVELLSFLTIGAAQGKKLVLFGSAIDVMAVQPWLISSVCLFGGGAWLRLEARSFHRVWDRLTADLKLGGSAMTAVSLRDVRKNFGPTEIIRGVTLDIKEGERHCIIGPNGAGKTTLFNLISGRFPITSGEVLLNGARIDKMPPHMINRAGLSRSFQITSIFPRLSVFENLRCALLWSQGYKYSFWSALWRQRALNDAAQALLEDLNLANCRDIPGGLLSYAEQRALEIGMTIAGGASVILLDEPTAGMSNTETDYAMALIRRVTQGKTLLMVEHDMKVVFDLADTITVLVYGQVIASGPPETVRSSKAVQEAYLGALEE